MTYEQFEEWKTFYELEPFDDVRADFNAALIAQTIANVHRNPKRRPSPYTMDEVIIHFGDSRTLKRQKTWQEMEAIGKMIARAHGATVS